MRVEQLDNEIKFFSLPVLVSKLDDSVLISRGKERFEITGDDNVLLFLDELLDCTNNKKGLTKQEIIDACIDVASPNDIELLFTELLNRRIILQVDEQNSAISAQETEHPTDIFYWSYGYPKDIQKKLATINLAIVGVNTISKRMVCTLQESGYQNITIIDHPLLRNLHLFDDRSQLKDNAWPLAENTPIHYEAWTEQHELPDCLVVTSDFGGLFAMKEWNEYCIKYNIPFFPVVLQDMIGYIGPQVIPKESACFECVWSRQNSHIENPELERFSEKVAFYGQLVNGYLPAMTTTLGDIASIELMKRDLPNIGSAVGKLIEVNLLNTEIKIHHVLKVPHCKVCGSQLKYSPTAIDRNVFLTGN